MGCCGSKEKEKDSGGTAVLVVHQTTIIREVREEDLLRAKLEAVFEDADTNRDGVLDRGEFKVLLHKAGFTATDDEMKQLFDQADEDKSDSLDFREFVIFFINLRIKIKLMMALRNMFEEMDESKTGNIEPAKLKAFFKQKGLLEDIPDETFDELVQKCDTNNDGKIQYEEFIAFFSELIENETP